MSVGNESRGVVVVYS